MTLQAFKQKPIFKFAIYKELSPKKYVVGRRRGYWVVGKPTDCCMFLLISRSKQALFFNVGNSFISQTGNK